MSINIRKGIGSVENLAKDCTTLLGTGGQCSTLHFNCGTALGFAIFYHISCFSEKTIGCPCDTFLKRNIQRTKRLLNGFYCGRLQINKPSGWKIMIRSAFIAHRPDWNQEFVFVQIGQHSRGRQRRAKAFWKPLSCSSVDCSGLVGTATTKPAPRSFCWAHRVSTRPARSRLPCPHRPNR